ncbi:glycosyltransferase family 9 protein [Helicobacter sp. MIT 14-3879]|uniref:glycosyltransferase family 9 protein n=1 Tax=Helicobacter sp. MIT 14-3879 TaxID=2040649 RepID=UPI000E1F48A5|nr:glycosyltransferase family 9 protein [Helicobacter sp. MIT 14-3879]RDU61564.1 hypothetical protein CQA44_08580 [Helicobacter sp. MIT 14-3879]
MNILIRLPNWLGDAIMLTPMIALLHKVYPEMQCILVGNALTASVFNLNDYIIQIFVDNSKQAKRITKRIQEINLLAANINTYLIKSQIKLDCAITTQNNFFSAFLLSKINVEMTIGYGDKNFFGLRKFLLTHTIKFSSGRFPACNHQVLSYANLLLPLLPTRFYQSIDLEKSHYISNPHASIIQNKLFSQVGKLQLIGITTSKQTEKNVIAISPGASYGNSKMWLPEYFSEVAISLIKRGYIIRIYGTKNEVFYNQQIESKIIQILPRSYHIQLENFTGKTSIFELIQSLQQCSLYIGNDSGSMHIAKALEIPNIVFFGPTPFDWCSPWSPRFYQQNLLPYKQNSENLQSFANNKPKNRNTHGEHIQIDSSIIIKKDLPCAPCYKRTCPLTHHNCMRLITPDEVLIIAESLLLQNTL